MHITDKADKTIEQTYKDIEAELEKVDTSELGDLLNIDVEEKGNERLRTEAIDEDPDMQIIETRCGEILDSLDKNKDDNNSDNNSDDTQ